MQVADDEASVVRELLASVREMLCAPSFVERWGAAPRATAYQRRRSRHDLDRLAHRRASDPVC